MNLLVDIGNSRLKWGWGEDGQIISGSALLNEYVSSTTLRDLWWQLPTPLHLAISCVGAGLLLKQVEKVVSDLWPALSIISVISQAKAFGVTNSYQYPDKLGVDRWLSLIAAHKQYQGPLCVVDCGTAITVDLLAADGRHYGGFIAPGLTLMKNSLAQGTQALRQVTSSHVFQPANNTDAAIYSGTLGACCGLIEHVLLKQPSNTRLVLTGGDALLIYNQLTVPSLVDHDLVLRGLLMVAEDAT